MKNCHDDLDEIIKEFKKKKELTLTLSKSEWNLLRIVICNFLADIKYKDMHEDGSDISDHIRESLQDIDKIGDMISELISWGK